MAGWEKWKEIAEPAEDTARRQIPLTAIARGVVLAAHKPQRDDEQDRQVSENGDLDALAQHTAVHEGGLRASLRP